MGGEGIIDVSFDERKLMKACSTDRDGRRHFGAERWKQVKRRLAAVLAAPCLQDLVGIGGFHELVADRAGTFSLSVGGQHRLILRPDHQVMPTLPDGGIDRRAVTAVSVVEVVDYHA